MPRGREPMKDKLKKLLGIFKDWDANKGHIRWLAAQGRPYTKQLLMLLGVSALSLVLSMASTVVGKYVVDWAVTDGKIGAYAIVMGAVTLATIGIGLLSQLINAYLSERMHMGLVADAFDRVQRGVWLKLSKFHTGDLMTRLTGDISTVSGGIISIVPDTILLILQLGMAFGILFYYDRMLALFALVLGPITAVCMIGFRQKYQQYQLKLRESESEYRSFMQERLENITVLKAFQLEDQNSAFMADLRARRMKTVMSSTRLTMWLSALLRFVFRLGYVVAFCWGAYRISQREITYGTMTVFLSLVSQVQSPMSEMAYLIPRAYGMLISAQRIREVCEVGGEDYAPRAGSPERVGVAMDKVTFGYGEEDVLREITLAVEPGERVGIVGTSGVGKTTFIRLAMAIVSPQGGSVRFFGERGFSEDACPASRRFIAYVPQGNTLISGTIAKNLLSGRGDATEAEMWKSLEMADAAEFVRKLPDGLNTEIGEHASGLSEGQAQRIAIARALIRDRPLLILDEATSALDEKTEARVLEGISRDLDATCLIITHRRSMLKYCDKVLEIDAGGRVRMDSSRAAGA